MALDAGYPISSAGGRRVKVMDGRNVCLNCVVNGNWVKSYVSVKSYELIFFIVECLFWVLRSVDKKVSY